MNKIENADELLKLINTGEIASQDVRYRDSAHGFAPIQTHQLTLKSGEVVFFDSHIASDELLEALNVAAPFPYDFD